jgi:tetratricopeptide (TPR) repeat protein
MRPFVLLLAFCGAARAEWSPEFQAGIKRADAALAAGRTDDAKSEAAGLLVPEGADAASRTEMLIKRGELKASLNDFTGAEADLRAAVALRPKDYNALCILTQFLRDRSRLAESLEVARVLVGVTEGIDPKNRAEKWLQRAETYLRLGRFAEAEADVKRALADKPEDAASLWLMAQVLVRADRAHDALPFADRMVAAAADGPERAHAYSQRAQIRLLLGDKKGAHEDVARGFKADPRDHAALEASVQSLRAEGRLDEALALADRMVEGGGVLPAPRRAMLLQQRAEVRRLRGDAPGAEADLRAALGAEPDALPPTRALAETLLDEGKAEESEALATRFLKIAAESAPGLRAEGFLLRSRARDRLGRRADAAADRAEAVRLAPASAEILRDAARAAGRTPEAFAYAERRVAATGASPAAERADALIQRAVLLKSAGRRAEADRDLARALELAPETLFAREQRVLLALEDKRESDAEARVAELFAAVGTAPGRAHAAALALRAKVRAARGLQKEADQDYLAALAEDPASKDEIRARMGALSRQEHQQEMLSYVARLLDGAAAAGRTQEAFAYAERLVAATGSSPAAERADALIQRAVLLKSAGRRAEADRDLARALEFAPDSLFAREQRVLLALEDKRESDAEARVAELFAAVGTAPGRAHAAALALRAKVRAARGLQKEADEDYLAALTEDPASKDEIRALLGALSRQEHQQEMMSYVARLLDGAAAAPPGDEEALKIVVEVLEEMSRQGRVDAAMARDGLLRERASRPAAAAMEGDAAQDARALRVRAATLLEHLGRARVEINDFAGAEADLRAGLAAHPGDFDVLCTLTQFLRERSRLTESLAAAQELVKVTEGIEPMNRAEKWLQRAETLMRLGRTDEAAADVARGLAAKPGDVPSLWLLNQIYLRSGRAREALPWADRMLAAAVSPAERAHAYSQRAQVRAALGDGKGADEDVARALAADPEDHIALEARVQRLRADGRLDEALALADRMVEAGAAAPPTRRAVLLEQRAQVRRARGDGAGAEADLRAALAVEPDALPPLRSLAEVLLEAGKAEESAAAATRYLAVAAESDPGARAAGFIIRARAEDWTGRAAMAAADRSEAVLLAPSSPQVLREAARAAGTPEAALALAGRLVAATSGASASERADALMARADFLKALGRRREAARDLDAALALAPESAPAREQVILLAIDEGRLDDADARVADFFALSVSTSGRERAAVLTLRAKVRAARGMQKESDDDFLAALAEDPGARGEVRSRMAALSRRGRDDEALAYGRRVIESASAASPGDGGALQAILDVVEELVREGRAKDAFAYDGLLRARAATTSPRRRADALMARASLLAAHGRTDEALAELRRAAATVPSEIEPWRRITGLLGRAGRTKEILAAADEFVAVSTGGAPSGAAQAYLWRAGRRAEAGNAKGASADHAAAEAAVPGLHAREPEAGAAWAAAEAARGGPPAAWALLARLRSRSEAAASDKARLAAAEAESRWSAGDAAGGRATFNAALAQDPKAACRATLISDRGRASLAYFDACLARFPDDAVLLNDRGVVLWLVGRKDAALADFRRAGALEPGFLAAALSLSTALEALGRKDEAVHALDTALAAPQSDQTLLGEAREVRARLNSSKR